jgi:hypothetical protein
MCEDAVQCEDAVAAALHFNGIRRRCGRVKPVNGRPT